MAKRRTSFYIFTILYSLTLGLVAQKGYAQKVRLPNWYNHAIDVATFQLNDAIHEFKPGQNPRSINPDGTVRIATSKDWTTGFFPGSLWYAFELTKQKNFEKEATAYTLGLDSIRNFKYTHDLGFMLFCSYGNAYRFTKDKEFLGVLEEGAANLYGRFNNAVGAIRSWDFGKWQFPVIIDNMMNLEFLFWAAEKFNKKEYYNAAVSHALVTMKNHFRDDYSSYHVVDYDTLTGKTISKGTHQGLNDSSRWARGQAWGVYGYTMCYRFTKDPRFLKQAEKIAAFIMNNPKIPKDNIPYWDYDDPKIPNTPRDASAAAVTASALLELRNYSNANKQKYTSYAESILKSLSSPAYLAEKGKNHYFILKHSVGALPNNSEVDTPLNYADYYYLEALYRYKQLKK